MVIKDLKSWRDSFSSNQKLVVTNGCFDILHAGHVDYLNKSKKLGDQLLVGINSDASIKILKGQSRPINSENFRAYVLDNLKAVDFVFIFNEPRCVNFLDQARPDIYTKAADYNLDSINKEELSILNHHNCHINFIKIEYNVSSTSILSKI